MLRESSKAYHSLHFIMILLLHHHIFVYLHENGTTNRISPLDIQLFKLHVIATLRVKYWVSYRLIYMYALFIVQLSRPSDGFVCSDSWNNCCVIKFCHSFGEGHTPGVWIRDRMSIWPFEGVDRIYREDSFVVLAGIWRRTVRWRSNPIHLRTDRSTSEADSSSTREERHKEWTSRRRRRWTDTPSNKSRQSLFLKSHRNWMFSKDLHTLSV